MERRIFLKHENQLFDSETLIRLRGYFGEIRETPDLDQRQLNAVRRGEAPDNLRTQEQWYDIWSNIDSQEKILTAVGPYTLVTFPPQVRNVRQGSHKVPWHQDIGYMRLLGNRGHQQVITCFVPLEDNPAEHTTIQFALDNMDADNETEFEHIPLGDFGAGINQDFNKKIHYDLKLGDALIFGDFTLHRTYTPERCKTERRSLEFRLVRPEHAISGKDYFDLQSLKFIKK
jgi:ectoine hydroxylase-related dioxygenase (phytanoyl-CoA dioxygenase family)